MARRLETYQYSFVLVFWIYGHTHNVICILHLSTKAVNGPMRGNVFIFPATIPPDYGSLKKDMRIVQCYVFTGHIVHKNSTVFLILFTITALLP